MMLKNMNGFQNAKLLLTTKYEERSMKKKSLVFGLVLIILSVMSLSATNNALAFSSDYITIGSNMGFGTINVTGECWVNIPGTSESGTFINIGGDQNGYAIGVGSGTFDSPGNELILIYDMSRWIATGYTIGTGWHHVAFAVDGVGSARAFLDGRQVHFSDAADPIAPSNATYIGASNASGGRPLTNGTIDEVRIWNISKGESDIRNNMYQELVGNETNLVAYYKFNETSGTTADNAEGTTAYDGILNGISFTNDAAPSAAFFGPKNCLNFDGADDNVWCPSITPTVTSGSIEFWVNLDVIPADNARLISRAANSQTTNWDDEIYLINNSGILKSGNGFVSGDGLESTNPLPLDVWTHVAITADGSGSKLFINGILDDTGGAATWSFDTFRFGGQFTGSGWEGIDGMMDEVRLWNDVRTESEIRENMFKTLVGDESNLVAYYNLDNASGAVAQSYPAQPNDGSIGGGPFWVASTAFNTWLNTDDSDWSTTTNWSSGIAPASTHNVGIYDYTGGTSPTLSGIPTVNNLVVGSTADLSLGSNVTINGNLFLYDDLDLNGQIITLGSSATLYESLGNINGTSGTIQTTRNLSAIIAENVAGLGAEITEDGDLGSTTIIRGHEAQGSNGIERYYQITTTNIPSDATLVFNYLDAELNGVTETDMKLFKSSDGVTNWTNEGGIVSESNNTLTLSGIDSFSWWTAGDGDGALPTTLSSFTAAYINSASTLSWTTQSEGSNLGWNVYRAESEEFFDSSVQNEDIIEGAGTSTEPTDYDFIDPYPVVAGNDYWFWLESISFSGESEVFGPVTLSVPNSDPGQNTPIIPETFGLYQNYPNPFNPTTEISFALEDAANCELTIYDIKGRKVKTLFTGNITAERIYSFIWNGKDESRKVVSSGIYYYNMKAGKYSSTKKMILLK
jgi:Concanavalin A-like lectin/glucanases superfamily/FlgD Ig-like domain